MFLSLILIYVGKKKGNFFAPFKTIFYNRKQQKHHHQFNDKNLFLFFALLIDFIDFFGFYRNSLHDHHLNLLV